MVPSSSGHDNGKYGNMRSNQGARNKNETGQGSLFQGHDFVSVCFCWNLEEFPDRSRRVSFLVLVMLYVQNDVDCHSHLQVTLHMACSMSPVYVSSYSFVFRSF